MWFGDLVTMRWWDDLWLNESFATYAATLCQTSATRWTDAWATFANVEKTWAYRQDQLPSTHPIATDAPDVQTAEVNFDGITYAKGASVLKQLGAYVGVEAFLAGLRDYFAEHAYGNTTLADLLRALEKSSGPRPRRLVEAVARDRRHQHAAPGVRGRRRRHVHLVRDRAVRPDRGRGVQHAAPAPAGRRPATRSGTAASCAPRAHRAGRHRRAHRRCPSWWASPRPAHAAGQRRRPHLLQAAAGRGQPAPPCATAASPSSRRRWPAPCAGRRRGT